MYVFYCYLIILSYYSNTKEILAMNNILIFIVTNDKFKFSNVTNVAYSSTLKAITAGQNRPQQKLKMIYKPFPL